MNIMTIFEAKMKVFTRDGFTCQKCKKMFGFSDLDLAHRIMKGKIARRHIQNWYQDRFFKKLSNADIDRIIHHPLNTVTSCKACNSSFNCFNNYCETEILLTKIIRAEGLGL